MFLLLNLRPMDLTNDLLPVWKMVFPKFTAEKAGRKFFDHHTSDGAAMEPRPFGGRVVGGELETMLTPPAPGGL